MAPGKTVTISVTLTLDEVSALGAAADACEAGIDRAKTETWKQRMSDAVAVLNRMFEAALVAGEGDNSCGHSCIESERARLVKQLSAQLLDEMPSSPDSLDALRDAGYRAGWNDRARSLSKELQS